MAFDKTQLTQMDQGNGFKQWRYDTLDAAADVDTAGYFTGEAVDMMGVGDTLLRVTWASAIRTGTVSTAGWHIVLSNDGTTVDVSDTTAIAVTDTD